MILNTRFLIYLHYRAVLGSYFLHERLGVLGKLGCAMCLLGSVVIVLHAPPDKPVERIDEILHYALQPGTPHFQRSRDTDTINPFQDSFLIVLRLPFSQPS